ncbi:B12-binding domain-containing radical SAM protein, partial [[Clostridium] scindens]|nr:B12-binding domain-containing radical SAM protein [[Clostridium] scindens]
LLQFFCEEAVPGRFRFEIGVQSFHTRTLHAVGRTQNNERLIEVIQRLKASGAVMHVDLIAGLPYEDLNSFQVSFDTLFSLQASELQLG